MLKRESLKKIWGKERIKIKTKNNNNKKKKETTIKLWLLTNQPDERNLGFLQSYSRGVAPGLSNRECHRALIP